jgi:hypothetical protein
MRNGVIGCGWFEEEDSYYDIKEVAIILLKEKLEEIWRISRERKETMDSRCNKT